jgi:hypothetical protein
MSAALLLAWHPVSLSNEADWAFERMASAFPARILEKSRDGRAMKAGRASLWSHEYSRTQGFLDDPSTGSWIGLVGNPARRDLSELEGERLLGRLLAECLERSASALDTLSPPFVTIFWDGRDETLTVSTDRCGLQHAYVLEDPDGTTWISSSLLALASALPVTFDVQGIAEWLGATHFLSQRTFFREIRKLACGERLLLGGKRQSPAAWLPTLHSFDAAAPEDAYLDCFIQSLQACTRRDGLASELTGGVDSRLVLAGLLAQKQPFFAWTLGNPGSVEVRTIARLRRRVPFDHVAVPVSPEELVSRLPDLVAEKHELGDGEENALQYAPLKLAFEALAGRRTVSVSGVPGELVRGFFFRALRARGRRVRGVPLEAFGRAVVKDSGGLHRLLRPEILPDPQGVLHSTLEEFLLASPLEAPEGLLEDFYLRIRMQRFAGRGTTTTGLFCRHALPYFGNDLVDLSLSLPYEVKWDGKVIRRALMKLSPKLASVPRESGIPIAPASWHRPDLLFRTNVALARKAAARYGGRVGRVVAAQPTQPIPWTAVRQSPVFREFTHDLLLAPAARINELLSPEGVRGRVEGALSGGSLYPLGLLMTLELTLRRLRTATER